MTDELALVGKLGYYLPQAIFGAILITVGSGLLTLLGVGTSTAEWAGYQVIIGIGRGFTTQVVSLIHMMKLHLNQNSWLTPADLGKCRFADGVSEGESVRCHRPAVLQSVPWWCRVPAGCHSPVSDRAQKRPDGDRRT